MKKFILAIPLLLFALSTSAQVDFGVKAGLNFSNIHYNLKDASPEGRTGFHVGTFVDFALNENFHLEPGVQYSTEGIKDGSIDYLNIPVSLKWYFAEKIQVNAGPQLGILMDAEGGTVGLNSTNFAGVFGLGYESASGFIIDTKYALGIANILDKDLKIDTGMGYTMSGFRGWTRAFQLSIGYKF